MQRTTGPGPGPGHVIGGALALVVDSESADDYVSATTVINEYIYSAKLGDDPTHPTFVVRQP